MRMKYSIISLLIAFMVLSPAFAGKIEEKDYVAYLFTYFTGNRFESDQLDGRSTRSAYPEVSGWQDILYGSDRYGVG